MKVKQLVLVVIVGIFSANIQAEEYTCPPSIDITAKMSPVPTGWSGLYTSGSGVTYAGNSEINDKLAFSGITLYAGEPKDQGSLVSDNEGQLQSNGAEQTSVWSFGDAQEQQKYPPYLVCNYAGSRFGVFQKITAPVKSCRWHEKPGEASNVLTCTPL